MLSGETFLSSCDVICRLVTWMYMYLYACYKLYIQYHGPCTFLHVHVKPINPFLSPFY